MVQNNDTAKPAKADKGSKKGTKAKKSSTRSKGRAAKAGVEELMQASSFVEPEDDDFEIKVAQEPIKHKRGTKRKSEDGQRICETTFLGGADVPSSGPPTKKRATRTRASSVQPESKVAPTPQEADDEDTRMVDPAATPPPPPPASKKAGKTGRKRASSNVRKASATSTASMASLRAVPDDDDIDAALEADLDRPLTDDEADIEPSPAVLPKTRRLTRTRPGSRNGPASTAPTRRTTRTSTITDTVSEDVTDEPAKERNAEQQPVQETVMVPKTKATKAAQSRKVSRKRMQPFNPDAESIITGSQTLIQDAQEQGKDESIPPRGARSRQASRQAPIGKSQATETPPDPSIECPRLDHDRSSLNGSDLESHGVGEESGHETDASIASQGPKKRGRKKATGVGKKVKAGKKTETMSRNIEDIVQPETTIEVVIVQPAPSEKAAVEGPVEPAENEIADTAAPKKGSKKKTAKSTKAKTIKTTPVIVPSSPPASLMSDPWTDQPLGESTPLQGARTDIPTFTPVEAAHTAPPPHAATPETKALLEPASAQKTPRLAGSPQSSDVENQPPSSRPSEVRPPLEILSPSKSRTIRVPLVASTPTASPSRRNISKLQTSMPWTAVDLEKFLLASPNLDKENDTETLKKGLTSPEKKLTVEDWIYHNARKGEEKLRNECERLVGSFEGEGVRALKTLEGIRCAE